MDVVFAEEVVHLRAVLTHLFILGLRCSAVLLLYRPALACARTAIRLVIEFAGRVAFLFLKKL